MGMEIFSQLAITSRSKLQYLPIATDLMATRTLLPGLVGPSQTKQHDSSSEREFSNLNSNFVVLVSNAVFGTDGLNNVILTQLEYGCDTTLIHLVYDSATTVSNYMQIGQPHRQ